MNARIANAASIAGESAGAESGYGFDLISDADLLTNTQRLAGRSNQLLADPRETPDQA